MAEVKLPELGESVTEGIITRWLVEVGDEVEADQPLVEISTDKVDTEIPSPTAGTVTELRFDVDDTVEVGQVIAVVGDATDDESDGDEAKDADGDADEDDADADEDDADADDTDTSADAEDDADADATDDESDGDEAKDTDGDADGDADEDNADADDTDTSADTEDDADADDTDTSADTEDDADADATEDEAATSSETDDADGDEATDDSADDTTPSEQPKASDTPSETSAGADNGARVLASPLVRRLLREAGIDASTVTPTGKGGRVTREDAEKAIAAGPSTGAAGPSASAPAAAPPRERPPASPMQVDFDGEREVTQDLTRIRKVVARAMMESLHNSAQLTAAVEADVTPIMNLRNAVKDDFKSREGASLTPLALIARAVCMTLPRHPSLNAAIDDEAGKATYRSYINLGIAVDTERGLLVPNIKDAHDLGVAGLARAIGDLAERTRGNKLGPDDIRGGTFTITNTGSMGTLFDTPILNPPEVAILATPKIEKRPVVVSDEMGDSIAIRWMTYLCLTYDHRMVDGADAARFLQDLKFMLETHDFSNELGT